MIRVVTPPAAYPVTLTEAKSWVRIDAIDTTHDATIDILIAMATKYAEHLTGRAYVERTLELSCDYFEHFIELPWAPLLGVNSVSYTDINGNVQTVSASDYEVDTVSEPGRVRPVWGKAWPSIGYGFNPVRIQYRAGYRPLGSPIDLTDNSYLPGELRIWMQSKISSHYDNRDQFIAGFGQSVLEFPRSMVDGQLDSLVLGTRLF